MSDKIEVQVKIGVPEQAEKLSKVEKGDLLDLDKASYPELHLQGVELPFAEDDVGKETPITGMVKLTSIKFQGYNYNFDLTQVSFPGRDITERGSIKARKNKRLKRISGIK
jgi:hypothetical protein